jgi:hypothetical protein
MTRDHQSNPAPTSRQPGSWLLPLVIGLVCLVGLALVVRSFPHYAPKTSHPPDSLGLYRWAAATAFFFGIGASVGASLGALFKASQLECAIFGIFAPPIILLFWGLFVS